MRELNRDTIRPQHRHLWSICIWTIILCSLGSVALAIVGHARWPLAAIPLVLVIAPAVGAILGGITADHCLQWGVVVCAAIGVCWAIGYWAWGIGVDILLLLLVVLPLAFVGFCLAVGAVIGLGLSAGMIVRSRREMGWRAAGLLAPYLLTAILIWLLPASGMAPTRDSDTAMIQNFLRNKAAFDQIVEMFDEDAGVVQIVYDRPLLYDDESTPPSLGVFQPRWWRYRLLFLTAGLKHGIDRRWGDGIAFVYWTTGMATGGSEKGYVYSPTPLQPATDSLDHISTPIKSSQPVFRQIADGWYLYYIWDD